MLKSQQPPDVGIGGLFGGSAKNPVRSCSLQFDVVAENDARDKSRSLGFSPGTNFASLLKSPVFFKGWGRAGMLGLHFVLGVRNARATFCPWRHKATKHCKTETQTEPRRAKAHPTQSTTTAASASAQDQMTRTTKLVVWASARARKSRQPSDSQCFLRMGPSRNARATLCPRRQE